MAITITSEPDFLEPAYQNSIPYNVISTLATASNFKYVFETYTSPTYSTTPFYTYRGLSTTYPRTDGTCIFSPQYILRDNISFDFNPYLTGFSGTTNSVLYYYIRTGESYNPGFTFASTFDALGFLGLSFSGTASTSLITTDDIIRIDKNNKNINPQYDGTASVTYSLGNVVVLNKLYGASSTADETGTIIDLRRMVGTSSIRYVFNGVRQYDEIALDFNDIYVMDGLGNNPFLTSYTYDNKPVYFDSNNATYETLSFLVPSTPYPTSLGMLIRTYDSSNTILNSYTYSLDNSYKAGANRLDFGVGPGNLTIMTSSIVKYTATLIGFATGLTHSASMTYSVLQQCKEYDLVTLAFKNKLGGFDYWTFHLVNKYRSTIKREEANFNLLYNYSIGDRGRSVIDQTIQEEWTVNSDLLTDGQALFIRELIESPEAYMLDGTNKLPIVITNDSYELQTVLNDLLVKYKITFKKSYDIISNV